MGITTLCSLGYGVDRRGFTIHWLPLSTAISWPWYLAWGPFLLPRTTYLCLPGLSMSAEIMHQLQCSTVMEVRACWVSHFSGHHFYARLWSNSWVWNIHVLSLYVCFPHPPNSSTDTRFLKATRLNIMLITIFIPTHPNTHTTQAHLNSYILLNMYLLKWEPVSCFLLWCLHPGRILNFPIIRTYLKTMIGYPQQIVLESTMRVWLSLL